MMTKKSVYWLCLGLVMSALLAVSASVYFCYSWLHTPIATISRGQSIDVPKGTSLYRVAAKLNSDGVLEWPRVWVQYAKLKSLTLIKAGEYQITAGVSPVDILHQLHAGNVVKYHVTLVEGLTAQQYLQYLQLQPKLIHKVEASPTEALLKQLNLDGAHAEGWFFPDTYQFIKGDSDADILTRAFNKMQQVLQEEWLQRAENLPYKTPYDALIMASIVEKETGVGYERDMIAGVFVRRLEKNMRLQTDPTVIYGMGDSYSGNLRRSDLKTPTPYNTYTNKGLPPTPIAMPGREAIYAALHPAAGSELYFVARGDGTHQFSDTLEEHEKAVQQYQKKRTKNYRSAPPVVIEDAVNDVITRQENSE